MRSQPKIAILGPFSQRSEHPHLRGIREALEELAIEADCYDYDSGRPLPVPAHQNYDLALYLNWDPLLSEEILESFGAAAEQTALWYIDFGMDNDYSHVHKGDIDYLFLTNRGELGTHKAMLQAQHAEFLPQACVRHDFIQALPEPEYHVFFGGQRQRNHLHGNRTALLARLHERYPITFIPDDYGPYRPGLHKSIHRAQERSFINLSVNAIPQPESAVSIRLWNLVSRGLMALQLDFLGLDELFEPGTELPIFSEESYLDRVQYFLSDAKARYRARRRCWQRAQAEHLYRHRFEKIFRTCEIR